MVTPAPDSEAIAERRGAGPGRCSWDRAAGAASDGLEPYLPHQGLVTRILADPIETRVDAQEHEPCGAFLDRDVEPPERLLHVPQARMKGADTPGRDHAPGARLGQLAQNSPRPGFVAAAGLEVPKAEGRSRHAAAHPSALLVLASGLVETAERFEGAREIRVRAVEAGIELDRLSVIDEGALVLACVVVRVSDARVDQHRQRVETERLQH